MTGAGAIVRSTVYAMDLRSLGGCCCGCGREVVTPLSPTDWKPLFDGETISLDPSIGNWSFPCRSHYWIRENRVEWARRWSREEIEGGRARDRLRKAAAYDKRIDTPEPEGASCATCESVVETQEVALLAVRRTNSRRPVRNAITASPR